jgi:DNA-binding Lrp family transcriptional regulator
MAGTSGKSYVSKSPARKTVVLDCELSELLGGRFESSAGYTAVEMSERLGVSKDTIRRRMLGLVKSGKWAMGFAYRERLDGQRARVPVYRSKEAANA